MSGLAEIRSVLCRTGRIEAGTRLNPLSGGVSSTVVTVGEAGAAWLAKRPLERMAVHDEWYADRSRALREAAVLDLLDGRLGPVRTPRLRFVDFDHMVLGMELIPPPARVWKADLLAGRVDPAVVTALAAAMTALHGLRPPDSLGGDGAKRLFEQLRLDPYYRTTIRRVPHLAEPLSELIDETTAAAVVPALVHGDLNPKNVLVTPGGPVVIDWELAHVGDPAFDLAMPVAHLLLKGCRDRAGQARRQALARAAHGLWDGYDGPARRDLAVRHIGGIVAARLWGKSPVDYLVVAAERDLAMRVAEMALCSGQTDLAGLTRVLVRR